MNEVIIYILKVMSIHGLLYLFYRLVLRNSGRHSFNRIYLLAALLAAFLIPLVEISLPERNQSEEEVSVIMWLSEPVAGIEEFELVPVKNQESTTSYWHLIPWIYGTIAVVLLIRSVFYLALLFRLKKQSDYIKKRWFKLFKISQDRPFSFFSNVFMPKSLFGTEAFDQILTHECEHVRQLHSLDRLLMDFVVSLFWFNPFIYLYRNALIEIHEFQADEVVLGRFNDPVGYQEILFSQLKSAEYSGLVSHFNFSMIKKRIVMMNKQRKTSGWVYVLAAPVTLLVIFAFSSKEAMEPINDVGDEIATIIGPENGFDLPEIFTEPSPGQDELKGEEQENVPEILPLRESDLVRFTSGFGQRRHPIDKQLKMHKGADFACPIGTEILAAADGKVTGVKTFDGGYGKLLTITHGVYKTRYAQLSEFKVKEGDVVKKGDVVALSGSSGASTAPHLHYEVLEGNKHVDPLDFIKNFTFKAKVEPHDHDEEEERMMAEEEKVLAQQEREMTEEALARERVEEMRVHEEMLLAEREVLASQLEQERDSERQLAIAELEREREVEEQKLMEIKLLNEKLKLEESNQGKTITFDGRSGRPLIVVDGKIVNDLSLLKVSDIEEIKVLKGKVLQGQRAKSLYGEKGSDGVVEITTKNKKKNKDKTKSKDKSKTKSKNKDSKVKEIAQRSFDKTDLIRTQRQILSGS